MNTLYTGIYNLFKVDTNHAFYVSVGGRLYPVKAPQETTFPFSVFWSVTAADELDFNEENEIFLIQFDIYTQNNSPLSAGTILANLKTMYDDCSLTVDGWRHLSMVRDFVVSNDDLTEDPAIMGYSVQYSVELEKAQ